MSQFQSSRVLYFASIKFRDFEKIAKIAKFSENKVLVMAERSLHVWNITISFKSFRLCYETYIKLFLNIDTLHLLLYFTLCFLSIFALSGFLQ